MKYDRQHTAEGPSGRSIGRLVGRSVGRPVPSSAVINWVSVSSGRDDRKSACSPNHHRLSSSTTISRRLGWLPTTRDGGIVGVWAYVVYAAPPFLKRHVRPKPLTTPFIPADPKGMVEGVSVSVADFYNSNIMGTTPPPLNPRFYARFSCRNSEREPSMSDRPNDGYARVRITNFAYYTQYYMIRITLSFF